MDLAMIVWLIKINEPLPFEEKERKGRTSLMADSLADSNDMVIWWTSTFNHYPKQKYNSKSKIIKIKENYHIYMLPSIGYKKNVSLMRYIDHFFVSKMFKLKSRRCKKPDLIIASSPWHHLAYEAIRYAKKNNIYVILDVRDPWPDSFLQYIPDGYKNLMKLLLFYDFHIMKFSAKNANSITAVSNSLMNFGLNYAEREQTKYDKVFYNGYKIPVNKNKFDINTPSLSKVESIKESFIVIYIGGFSELHDPSILLAIADSLKSLSIQFVLAGKGEKYAELENKSKMMNNIHLVGWLNNNEIAKLISYGNVGFAPTNFVSEILPNKAIMYLSGGLPVISAFHGDLRIIINKYQAGLNYTPGNMVEVKNAIRKLYDDEELYKQMSKNALVVYNNFFRSDLIFERYKQFVKEIVSV